jgi:hypothetical protein
MGTTARIRRWIPPIAVTLCLPLFAATAQASEPRERTSSVEERAKAAEAYDQGTSAYLAESYERAAHWFERAYRLVPTSTALLQAVRAHDRAGNSIRAANLGLQLRNAYPSDARSQEVADAVIASVQPGAVLVRARCEQQCTLELDGALVQHPTFFVTPEVEHTIKAAFEHGETSAFVHGSAGETKEVALSAPSAPAPPPVPRWAFFSSLGATVALGAATIWSGVDAKNGVSTYESAARAANSPGINNAASPTPEEQAQALLDEGRSKERRTNILIGVTAAMAAGTVALGVFTNWKGESREATSKRIEPTVGVSHRGGSLAIKGRF